MPAGRILGASQERRAIRLPAGQLSFLARRADFPDFPRLPGDLRLLGDGLSVLVIHGVVAVRVAGAAPEEACPTFAASHRLSTLRTSNGRSLAALGVLLEYEVHLSGKILGQLQPCRERFFLGTGEAGQGGKASLGNQLFAFRIAQDPAGDLTPDPKSAAAGEGLGRRPHGRVTAFRAGGCHGLCLHRRRRR